MTRSFALLLALAVAAVPAVAADHVSDTPTLRADDGDLLARRRRRKKKAKSPPSAAPSGGPSAADEAPLPARRGPSRVDFDERLIKGQTNKANAIYLFQRRESRLRTLVKKRKHFHELIDETLE
jgi:hypothetical protein